MHVAPLLACKRQERIRIDVLHLRFTDSSSVTVLGLCWAARLTYKQFAPLRPWISQERIRIESLLEACVFSTIVVVRWGGEAMVGLVQWGIVGAVGVGEAVGCCGKQALPA